MKSFFVNKHEVIVDDDAFVWASQMNWTIDRSGNTFYARNVKGRLHRLVMGITDPMVLIDHKNGNGLDNRKSNLRRCSVAENNRNCIKEPGKTSSFKGVSWKSSRKKWQAQIKVNGIVKYLGLFDNERNGAIAYNEAAQKYHGDFALLNQI